MTTIENKRETLANFIMKICSKERYIEVRRQLLCDKNDFEPYVAFTRLSRSNESNGVTGKNIQDFLRESMIDIRQRKTQALLKHYDSDSDDVLSYKEFLDIVLPKEHPDLRAFVTQRECFDITNDEYLGYETEAALALLLEKELSLFDEIMEDKEKLDMVGIGGEKIVEIIDGDKTGSLNFNNLRNFVHECGIIPYDSEIIAFLRRVDRDDDGVINAEEMQKFLHLFNYCDDPRLGRRRRSNLKCDDLKSKSPRRKIVNHKVSLLSSRKSGKKQGGIFDTREEKRGPLREIEGMRTSAYRRGSIAPQSGSYDMRGSGVRRSLRSSLTGGKPNDRKVVGGVEEKKPPVIPKIPILALKNNNEFKENNPSNIVYDVRRESFGANTIPSMQEPAMNSSNFELSQNTFNVSSLKKSPNAGFRGIETSSISKSPIEYSPRRQSFGIGMAGNNNEDIVPIVFETVESKELNSTFRKRIDELKRPQPLAEITPNRVKERKFFCNRVAVREVYRTPVHGKKEEMEPRANNTPNNFIKKTNLKVVSPMRASQMSQMSQMDAKISRIGRINLGNIDRARNGKLSYDQIRENLEPNIAQKARQEQQEVIYTPRGINLKDRKDKPKVSPVVERTPGYSYHGQNSSRRDRAPQKTPPKVTIHTTTTPVKTKSQTKGKKLRNSAKLKSALKTSTKKPEKSLSVRWADEDPTAGNLTMIADCSILGTNDDDDEIFEKKKLKFLDALNEGDSEETIKLESGEEMESLEYDSKGDQHLYFSSLTQNVEIKQSSEGSNPRTVEPSISVESQIVQQTIKIKIPKSLPKIPKPEKPNLTEKFALQMKRILAQEAKLDQSKRDLFANPDFNIKKLVNLIKPNQNEQDPCISFDDFRAFLDKIGIKNPDPDAIIDLFTSYDKEQTYNLDQDSISKMVFPFDRRVVREGQYNKKDFYRLTMRDILTVFEFQLKTREIILQIKRELSEAHVDLCLLFEGLDKEKNGYIEKKDFYEIFAKFDKDFNKLACEEIQFFIERCDLDGDGKINFRDFYLFFSL